MSKVVKYWLAIACAIAGPLCAASTSAQSLDRDFKKKFDWLEGVGNALPSAQDAAFYRSFAKPSRGGIVRTTQGPSWVLETDERTKIAYPRLVALPDRRSVQRVNQTLATVHGWTIRVGLEYESGYLFKQLTPELQQDYRGQTGYGIGQRSEVTYLSHRYLGVVEYGNYATGGSNQFNYVRGVTFDLQDGSFFSIKRCDTEGHPFAFTFGGLIVACSKDQVARFLGAWREQYDEFLIQTEHHPLATDPERCRWYQETTVPEGSFSLYLTDKGLAVYAFEHNDKHCIGSLNLTFNPIVVPYRKLASLMQPGPLKEELLGDTAR